MGGGSIGTALLLPAIQAALPGLGSAPPVPAATGTQVAAPAGTPAATPPGPASGGSPGMPGLG